MSVVTVSHENDREGEWMNRGAMSLQAPTDLESLHPSISDLVGMVVGHPHFCVLTCYMSIL